MSLKTSNVYRCLDKKTYVFGFEIVDLFLVFAVLAILNLLLGGLPYKFFLTWVPAMALGLGLRLGKKGKPDNYLLHLARFYFSPGVLSSFALAPTRRHFIKKGK